MDLDKVYSSIKRLQENYPDMEIVIRIVGSDNYITVQDGTRKYCHSDKNLGRAFSEAVFGFVTGKE